MARLVIVCISGVIAWWVLAALFDLQLRWIWPGYVAAEDAMIFTMPMMFARLGISLLATLLAGALTARFSRPNRTVPLISGILLLLWVIPVHNASWDKFPIWYHAWFLITLLPLFLLGARWGHGQLR